MRAMESENEELLRGFSLLTLKPLLRILNLDEEDLGRADDVLSETLPSGGLRTANAWVCGAIEKDLAGMQPEEAGTFMQEFGITIPGRDRVIGAAYRLLGLVTFFTVGEDECRAWTIPEGASALTAAGRIHSDLARGFIRAEVLGSEELLELGSFAAAKDSGRLRLEGKDYPVKDGEVVHIRFNV